MNKSEKMIRKLKNRKVRIVTYFIVIVFLAIFLAYCIHVKQKAFTVCTQDDIKTIIVTVHMPPEVAKLISSCLTIANVRAELMLSSFFSACMLGLMLGVLICELTGYNKNSLLVTMWDEIQELKAQNCALKQKRDIISQPTDASNPSSPDR